MAQPYGHNSITGTPVRSKPGDEYVAAGMKDFQEKKSDMDHTVQASQAFMDNMSQVANVVQRAKFGPWQSVREDLSNLVRNNPILSVIPGGDALGKRWADTIAGGSDTDGQAAVREFEKMSVLAAWQQLKSNVPATSGQRVAMQEFLIQLEKGTTNPNMPPEAIYNLLRQYNRQHQRNVWEANKYNEFASQAGENTDFGQAQNWINKQRESYQINVNGKTYQTGHDMQGRPWIVVPNPQNGKPMRVYDNGQQLP